MASEKIPITTENKINSGQIGDVVNSILDEASFQDLRGSGWVLMDGRDITGTPLAAIIGNTLPDARGQFLRAKNNGRADGQEDPDGERALGTQQTDRAQGHHHTYLTSTGAAGSGQQFIAGVSGSTRAGQTGGTPPGQDVTAPADDGVNGAPRTGLETNPKNLAVNTYVRIN